MSEMLNITHLQDVDDNDMKHAIQSIIIKHGEMAVVMLGPASLRLQESLCYQYAAKMKTLEVNIHS